MAKINLDKYYTSKELAKHCIDVVNGLGLEITETIEPSAGNGSFSLQIPNCIAYDLEPEHESIIKQDFLKLELPYKKGRLFIGNPPFGKGTVLSNRFAKKCFKIGDYVAFILPICQMNNMQELFEFDLIYSEDLGVSIYSEVDVHCCFNIYKRPPKGLNKREPFRLKDIIMKEVRKSRNQFLPTDFKYDIGICIWGSIGKECFGNGGFAKELYIKCQNERLSSRVTQVIKDANWNELVVNKNKTPSLTQRLILMYLKEQIPELN